MKTTFFLLFLSFSLVAFSQVITEEELSLMVKDAQEKCAGAHQSILLQANEDFAKAIWDKKVRFNEASIVRFFTHSAGEKVSGRIFCMPKSKRMGQKLSWSYIAPSRDFWKCCAPGRHRALNS